MVKAVGHTEAYEPGVTIWSKTSVSDSGTNTHASFSITSHLKTDSPDLDRARLVFVHRCLHDAGDSDIV